MWLVKLYSNKKKSSKLPILHNSASWWQTRYILCCSSGHLGLMDQSIAACSFFLWLYPFCSSAPLFLFFSFSPSHSFGVVLFLSHFSFHLPFSFLSCSKHAYSLDRLIYIYLFSSCPVLFQTHLPSPISHLYLHLPCLMRLSLLCLSCCWFLVVVIFLLVDIFIFSLERPS